MFRAREKASAANIPGGAAKKHPLPKQKSRNKRKHPFALSGSVFSRINACRYSAAMASAFVACTVPGGCWGGA